MIYFYSSDYKNRYLIFTTESISFKAYYNKTGTISITLPLTEYNVTSADEDGLIYLTDFDLLFTIQKIKIDVDENSMTIDGSTADDILRKRVVPSALVITNVEAGIYSLVSANLRGYTAVQVASASGLVATVSSTNCYGNNLISIMEPILTSADYGRKMVWDDVSRKMTFTIYEGRDLTVGVNRVVFSEERGTASDFTATENTVSWFNTVYVECKDNTQVTHIVEVGTATGDDRHEMFTRFSGEAQGQDETLDTFLARVRQYGELQLNKYGKIETFSVSISSDEYGTKYKMGDKIRVLSLKVGKVYDVRITGIQYTADSNGADTVINLGTPTINMLDIRRLGND